MQSVIQSYASKADAYPLPDDPSGSGMVRDPASGTLLIIGFLVHRETFHTCGFLAPDAPEKLVACVCGMLELVQDMPVIKARTLTPVDILAHMGITAPDEETERFAAMALTGLMQAVGAYIKSKA